MSTSPALSLDNPPADTADFSAGLIARQAIVDHNRAVVGYELFDRSTPGAAHSAASDAALLFNALSSADADTLFGKKLVFINCTHESLAGGHLELVQPERVVLEVPVVAGDDPDEIAARGAVLQSIKARGFRIALDQNALKKAYAAWLPLAAFVKLDVSAFRPQLAEPLVRFVHSQTQAQVIAERIETAEQHAQMAGYGVKFFQGYWFAKPALVQARTVRPAQATIIQLINLVRQQADVSDIENLLKKDPTLSFNLLRFINSSGFGLSAEITSFRHAVMILGMKKLFRWAALLMTTSRDGSPPALGTTAVVRGRLMELLAAELMPPEECDNAFVVGVFSLLDAMLGLPMDKALESVALPLPVLDALLHRKGIFAPFLELTIACESGDEAAFAKAANALALSNHQVNWAHLNALSWADSMGDAG